MTARTSTRYELVGCGRPLEPRDMPLPEPVGTEVLLRVVAAGVCHTDLHLSDGFFDLGRGQRIALTDRGIKLPHTLGHESVGEVVALGPQASGVSIGDRVLAYPWIGCDDCPRCAAGQGHLCTRPRFLGVFRPGGFSDHLLVPSGRYLFDIAHLPADAAAPLACSGLTAWSAIGKAGSAVFEAPALIIGAGGLGLMCLSLLGQLGAPRPVVIDPQPTKRAAALEMGARDAFGNDETALAGLSRQMPEGVGVVFDFVGSPSSIAQGVELLGKGGQLIVVGMYGGELSLPIPTLVLKGIGLQGSYVGSLEEMRALMAHVQRHGLPALPLVSRPMSEINRAFDAVRAGAVVGRTVLHP